MGFSLIPKQVTWSDLECPFYVKFRFCASVLNKVGPILSVSDMQKFGRDSIVSGNIRFMRIFVGILWK